MTIFAAATAGPAAARIRGYSMALWAVGVLAIGAIIGLTAFSVALAPGGDSPGSSRYVQAVQQGAVPVFIGRTTSQLEDQQGRPGVRPNKDDQVFELAYVI